MSVPEHSDRNAKVSGPRSVPAQMPRNGEFDFSLGVWEADVLSRERPLSDGRWNKFHGSVIIRPFWEGAANLEEFVLVGDTGRRQGLSLRIYQSLQRQWNIYQSTSGSGVLSAPMRGIFAESEGAFVGQTRVEGRNCLARLTYSDISPESHRVAQEVSSDGGSSWFQNWEARLNKRDSPMPAQDTEPDSSERKPDFDFHFGTWTTHVARKLEPLDPGGDWVDYEGSSEVTSVWGRTASLFELKVSGPAGEIQGAGLRLFNPSSGQWSLNWANRRAGEIVPPAMFGDFRDGEGVFFSQETYDGRAIFSRNRFFEVTPASCRFDQSFSTDRGKTWITNWKMQFARRL